MALNIVTGVSFVPFIVCWPLGSFMVGYVIVQMGLSGSTPQDAGERASGCELYLMQQASLNGLIITNVITSSV